MGVPKFFRFISERYPCLSEVVKQYQIPEFDNLYLDMNGIIHTCSHPDDGNAHFRITEEKIFEDIFHYIEVLFRMIRPQKLFFMAVDGVAPRAKMNQQRGRRFRSAKDAEKLEKEALKKGEVLPSEERFDSNCITPGTEFMARLHEQLKYFVVTKVSTDKLWKNCKVVLSGHETPGEGEHKIMDYIRYMRSQPGYDPNTRHCLYGLDADLIMLGLCTHEPHFSLLREEVKFGKKTNQKRSSVPEDITFYLLHLSLLREYLELEFSEVKDKLKGFEFDIEKIIDDWVLMGFLVGNDFIPHLPNLHISDGALPILYKAYMELLPTLDGYINEAGKLNLPRFEKLMQKLGKLEEENFEETRDDLLYMERKTGRKYNPFSKVNSKQENSNDQEESPHDESERRMDPGLAALIQEAEDMALDSEEDEEESDEDKDDDDEDDDFVNYKRQYYRNKLEFENVTREVMRDQAEGYVRAIQWNLHYYYNGVCSWSWYYPHHYAPYISDIKGFSDLKIDFDLGKPFLPYEQLLAVLPPASKKLLPKAYHDLMTDESSLIKNYYPEEFQTDLNGKKQEWEAVVLVPFIDEKKLLEAMKSCNEKLTDEEKKRNTHGPMLIYQYTTDDLGPYSSPSYFPTVENNHTKCIPVSIEDIRVPREKLIKGPYPGAKFDVYYPGFPTMKHLKYTGHLEKARVKVFEQPSRNESMILKILSDPVTDVPEDLIGTIVYVGWPHLVEAKVVAIACETKRYIKPVQDSQVKTEEINGNKRSIYYQQVESVIDFNKTRWGIDYKPIQFLVQAQLMIGRKYAVTPNGRITLEKQFAKDTTNYAIQGIVKDIAVYNKEDVAYKDLDAVFPVGSTCFVLVSPYYGAKGNVLGIRDGRLKINLEITQEPDLTNLYEEQDLARSRYKSLYSVATSLSMSNHLFSRLTGTILLSDGSGSSHVNVGLDLKFNKKNMETPGYTKKIDGVWHYTDKVADLIEKYSQKFPEVVNYLSVNPSTHDLDAKTVFGEDYEAKVKALREWLKTLPTYNMERRICGSEVVDPDVVKEVENHLDRYIADVVPKKLIVQIKPQFVFNPDLQTGNLMPDSTAEMKLLDRVVNVREGFTVPLGLKGVLIGIHKSKDNIEADIVYDIVFDRTFVGGLALNCSDKRGYRLPRTAFINISHGVRQFSNKIGKPVMDTSKHRFAQNPQYTNRSSYDLNGYSMSESTLQNLQSQYYQSYDTQYNSAFATFKNNSYKKNAPPRFRDIRGGGNSEDAPLYTWHLEDPQNNKHAIKDNYSSHNASSQQEHRSNYSNFMPEFSRGGVKSYGGNFGDMDKRPPANIQVKQSVNINRRENYAKREYGDNRILESNKNNYSEKSHTTDQAIDKPEKLIENKNTGVITQVSNEAPKQSAGISGDLSSRPEKPLEGATNKESEKQNTEQKADYEKENSLVPKSPRKNAYHNSQIQSQNNDMIKSGAYLVKQDINQESRSRKVNTDFLKTLVKLNTTTNAIDKKMGRPGTSQVISQQQQQQHRRQLNLKASYSVQLLNYFQSNGYGLPRFQFIGSDSKRAQITLPNKKVVMGPPASTEEEASELAAKAALEAVGMRQSSPDKSSNPDVKSPPFPVPPQQWVENPSSPSKRFPYRNVEHKRMPSNQYQSQRFTNQRILASEEAFKKNREATTNSFNNFVPLQAIRHASTKQASPQQNQNKAFITEAPSHNQKNESHVTSPRKEIHKKDQSEDHAEMRAQRKRPERKMRLAANFPANPQ